MLSSPVPTAIQPVDPRFFGSAWPDRPRRGPAMTTIPATQASAPSRPARANRIVSTVPTATNCTKARTAAISNSRVRPKRARMDTDRDQHEQCRCRDAQPVWDVLGRVHAKYLISGSAAFDQSALMQNQNAVRQIQDAVHIVGDQHNGETLGDQGLDDVVDRLCRPVVQRAGRFVEQQDLRIEGQRPGQGDPLLLPAGQCRGRGIQAHTGQSHAVEQGVCLVVGQLGLGYP